MNKAILYDWVVEQVTNKLDNSNDPKEENIYDLVYSIFDCENWSERDWIDFVMTEYKGRSQHFFFEDDNHDLLTSIADKLDNLGEANKKKYLEIAGQMWEYNLAMIVEYLKGYVDGAYSELLYKVRT